MKRREFMSLLGAGAAWPLAAGAQQPSMPVIGFLSGRSPGEAASAVDAFREGLGEIGYIEGTAALLPFEYAGRNVSYPQRAGVHCGRAAEQCPLCPDTSDFDLLSDSEPGSSTHPPWSSSLS